MGSSRGTKCFCRAERRSRGVRRMEALTGATAAGEEGKGLFTGRRILIAEDNEITAEIICEILRMCGIITEVESNALTEQNLKICQTGVMPIRYIR